MLLSQEALERLIGPDMSLFLPTGRYRFDNGTGKCSSVDTANLQQVVTMGKAANPACTLHSTVSETLTHKYIKQFLHRAL